MTIKFEKIKRPKIKMVVKEGEKYLWPQFHSSHYMTANKSIVDSLPRSSKFFTFYWVIDNEEILVGCLGVLNQISNKPARRITRMVVKEEFQGLGFSKIMLNNISELYRRQGIIMYITTFHPRLGQFFENSNEWEPSANNMKAFKSLKEKELSKDIDGHPFENSLRDGVAMYRYHYVGNSDYSLEYNPLVLEDLLEESKDLDDNGKEYKKLKRKINAIQRAKDSDYKEEKPEETKVDNPEHIKRKEEHNRIFKKKRKVLSASERKAKRDELKAKKAKKSQKDKEILDDF